MNKGKAFEILMREILINIGFTPVPSDGLYVFDGRAGQMIQGLGEAHNADVLLEPPAQTPFYTSTRILIECKNYITKVGLNTIRSALGLREDINNFDIIDADELIDRRNPRRIAPLYNFERYYYQVAVASLNGYTVPAQNFAARHRLPLLEFHKMPFWNDFCRIINDNEYTYINRLRHMDIEHQIVNLARDIGERTALAITNSGQMLFLFCSNGGNLEFDDYYSLHWSEKNLPWELHSNGHIYKFQLPECIMKTWLDKSSNDIELKREAINCKQAFMSNMIVYYKDGELPVIKMIRINEWQLEEAKRYL